VKLRQFRVTSGYARSSDVILCHVTATYCELQPCRSSNLLKTRDFHLLQPLPGDFRWNDVTCGSRPVVLGHATLIPVTWLPPPASYIPERAQTYPKPQISAFYSHFQWLLVKWCHFQVTFGRDRSHDAISCHVTATSCELQPCRSSNVHKTRVISILQPLQVTSGQMKSLPAHFRSREVTWHHFLSRDCHLLRVTAL